MESFGNASGLKLNKHKTEGLWLGQHGNRNDKFENINWSKTCIKALGVYFAYDSKEAEEKKLVKQYKKDLTHLESKGFIFTRQNSGNRNFSTFKTCVPYHIN